MDIRRGILWMIFLFSVFMVWSNWQSYNAPKHVETATTTQSNGATPTATTAPAVSNAATQPSEKVQISTDVFNLTFDTLGAQIVRAELLDHHDAEDKTQPTVLLSTGDNTYTVQSGLVGAAGTAYPKQDTPFTLVSSEKTLTGDSLDVVFRAESGGLEVTRTYTLHKGSYRIDVKDSIKNISDTTQNPSQYLQITRDNHKPAGGLYMAPTYTGWAVYSDSERFQKVTFEEIDKNTAEYVKQAPDGWISFIQHFFVTAWIPEQGKEHNIQIRKAGKDLYAISSVEPLGAVAAGQTVDTKATLWVGPQDQKALAAIDPTLDLVVDYGWLTLIAKPMFKLMSWLHSWIGNWGWTIVVLTIIIKIILYPLSAASYRSMAKMKEAAPRMQALREQYGDDRQKLNAAMMEMYRTEKINPLGGCLPIMLQIPVFLTLYRVLLASVEMRGAPWLGWIHDLSVADPYFILPIIMIATMFIQMKLNPTPPDPMQARIMMIMPLVFGVMMLWFPAGLVLYWIVNNVLSIAQQQWITRHLRQAANEQILTHK
ncbi:membrane protein insertase YidC [Pelistega europaea]|uniref:Membrane protein insertase YidC n=1 Tax=Pelistega europaea TaxID=106147 RepID=A0A7Y4P308_9BURK|nr:membrane protein insertase YidC [Pelistega europaea]NOL48537.1 membrane protein insertase YidC [Pelistega europaea]